MNKKRNFFERHPSILHYTLGAVGIAIALGANMAYSHGRVERMLIDTNRDGQLSQMEIDMYYINTHKQPTNSFSIHD